MPPAFSARYKECFVHDCTSNTTRTPEKHFFGVPLERATRKRWFQAVRPGEAFLPRKHYYCCQDHFDLKEDLVNFEKYTTKGTARLKKEATPRVDLDKPLVSRTPENVDEQPQPPKKAWLRSSKRKNDTAADADPQPSFDEPMPKLKKINSSPVLNNESNASLQLDSVFLAQQNDIEPQGDNAHQEIPECSTQQVVSSELVSLNNLPNLTFIPQICSQIETSPNLPQKSCESRNSTVTVSSAAFEHSLNHVSQPYYELQIGDSSVKINTKPNYVAVKPIMIDAACQCNIPTTEDRACSPIEIFIKTSKSMSQDSSTDSSTDSQQTLVMMKNKNNELYPIPNSKVSFEATMRFLNNNPKAYIGIEGDKLQLIEELNNNIGCSVNDIKLTLMKIKRNDSFVSLARSFKISTIQAITIFNKTVGLLAFYLKRHINVPSAAEIKKNLPLVFCEDYSHVCAIIDVLEIDIEKPLDPLKSAWPSTETKKFCTLKYLIACTPDGLISFVSSGYGGAVSDVSLFRESKIINALPESSGVMTNSEFDENVEILLSKKKCQLIRLQACSSLPESGEEFDMTADKELEMSLRYNAELTMSHLREFQILASDAGLDLNFMSHVDNIVTVVAGLVNYNRIDEKVDF